MGEKKQTEQIRLIGYDAAGAPVRRELPAGQGAEQAEDELRRSGGRVLRTEVSSARGATAQVSPEDFARFNEMLASAIQRRVPLPDGLRQLAFDVHGGSFKRSVGWIASRIEAGRPLTEALESQAGAFPPFYGRLLKAGAAAGNLPEVLITLSRNIRMHVAFRRAILTNVVYPVMLLVACVGILGGFGLGMIPRAYSPVSSAVEMNLPTLTEFLTGQTLQSRLTLSCAALIVLFIILSWGILSRSRAWINMGDSVARRLPYARRFYEAAVWSNAADMLALMLRARVPAPEAFRLVADALGRPWVAGALHAMADRLERGESAGAAADALPIMPRRVARALIAADISGAIEEKLEALSAEYRAEAERRAENFIRYLPAAGAVVMGLIVGTVVLALLLPLIRLWGARW